MHICLAIRSIIAERIHTVCIRSAIIDLIAGYIGFLANEDFWSPPAPPPPPIGSSLQKIGKN